MIMGDRKIIRDDAFAAIRAALNEGKFTQGVEDFSLLIPGDQAEVFNALNDEDQALLLSYLDVEATADLFDTLQDSDTLDAAESLSLEKLADVLEVMEPDEAADLLGDLSPEQASLALEEMEDIEDVLPLLEYPDNTAGGRMTTTYVAVRRNTTREMTIEFLRHLDPDVRVPNYIFVVDYLKHLVGIVGLRQLLIAFPETRIEEIMEEEVVNVTVESDQEEVARVMTRYDLSVVPVVNNARRLMGVITHDDILDVLNEEATEDVYRLANVSDSELDPDSSIGEHLKGRLPWLFLNTLTAMFSSWIISNFEGLIAQVAVLAAFQTVVAGLGGNASTQTIALIVRAIALGKLTLQKSWRALLKEFFIGFLQGGAVGLIAGLGVYLWRGNFYLGLVLGLAIVGNLVMAAIVGTIIPLGLKAIKQDPALASPVLVTAVTDSFGFLLFLSLATLLITHLT